MGLGTPDVDDSDLPAAVGGVRWTLLTYVVGKGITLAATIALARLLAPADFGVVMLAFVAINLIGLFGDLGLGATLVVRRDLDGRSLGTALALLLGTGALLGLVLAGAAPLLAGILEEPRLRGVLTALAPLTVIGAVTWFYQWLLQRELEFRVRFLGFLGQAAVYAAVAVGAAAAGAGVWSIVAGHLAGQVAMAAIFLARAPRVRPGFDRTVARDLLRSSGGFFLQNTATLVQQNADYLAIGHALGSAPLGLYSLAFRVSELPHLAVADPVAKVTFPTFARMQAAGEDVNRHYLSTLRIVALVTAPWGVLVSAVASPFIRLVYGSRWLPMVGALAVLAVWGAVKSIQSTIEWFLNAVGGSGAAGGVAAVVLALQLPALFLAADAGGIEGVAWVVLGGVALSAAALVKFVGARTGVGAGAHAVSLWPILVAAGTAWVAARSVAVAVGGPAAVACGAGVAVGTAVYLGLVTALAPGSVRMAVALVRQVVRAGGGAARAPGPVAPAGAPRAAPGRSVEPGEPPPLPTPPGS